MIPAFPKIFTLGMRDTDRIFEGRVEVTEKIDGSQFSFGVIEGQLHMRSKGAIIYEDTVQAMFKPVCNHVMECFHEDLLPDGMVFHGETLQKPRHNTLEYGRVPTNHFMLFGIRMLPNKLQLATETAYIEFIDDHDTLTLWALKLDFEPVPLLYHGKLDRSNTLEQINEWIDTESCLGKANMEGVVIKNYSERVLIGGQVVPILAVKYVSEKFKETNNVNWKKEKKPLMEKLGDVYRTEARWHKAIQHMRDDGNLDQSPKDIGPLFKEIIRDLEDECKEEIKEAMWQAQHKDLFRVCTRGFAEWYKEQLVKDMAA